MESISVKDLTFTYPGRTAKALDGISFSIEAGQFVCLCGRTGSGKSTLMRSLKPVLAPHGEKTGSVLIFGKDMDELTDREGAARIGYVMQNPDNQIVTDKVWHELAFGPENIGMDPETIRVRVAEMATFFGIHNWFERDTDSLSGGQKQMLNLAAIMVMQPDILLLDEPTASLDPVAAVDFLSTVSRICREIGTTIIICEHRLDEVLQLSDRVLVMDEGRLTADGSPAEVGLSLIEGDEPMAKAMPAPLRAYAGVSDVLVGKKAPLDVAAGRRWLMDVCSGAATETVSTETVSDAVSPVEKKETAAESVIEVKGAWMRYERDSADVLKGLSLMVRKGEILALVGGNGAGKATLMTLRAGAAKPYRGKVVRSAGTISMLPQNPQLLFTEDTLEADLRMIATNEEELGRVTDLLQLAPLLTSHPFDLSGGEQQRAALAKVLLSGADVILLDEPTKGLDEGFKEIIGNALRSFVKDGGTVVVTTHDVDFCARTADRCAMLFNGQITGEGAANTFFHGNEFYTTAANRMSRGILDALFAEEIVEKIKAMER